MTQTNDDATLTQIQTIQPNPKPEGYVTCSCCEAILGYKAHIKGVLYFYLFSYAPHCVAPNLAERRVNGRLLNGDALCPHCGTWKEWTPASNFPFTKTK